MLIKIKNWIITHGTILTCLISGICSTTLAYATRHITYWPTDSAAFYIPTARVLFKLPFISQLHDLYTAPSIGRIVLHSKENLILLTAVMQNLLRDPTSLFPNVLVLIIANGLSSVLVYQILVRAFNKPVAWIGFLLLFCSYWPHMYTLQGAHQPLVLFFFLLTLFCLIQISSSYLYTLGGGFSFGFMFFSSPTSFFYMPYFLLPVLLRKMSDTSSSAVFNYRKVGLHFFCFLLSSGLVFLFFTAPDPINKLHDYFGYLFHSQFDNHFSRSHAYIHHILPYPYSLSYIDPVTFRGGGWNWIIRYFIMTMPHIIISFLIAVIYLFKNTRKKHYISALILITFSTPLIVESARVAQFARNYFSWFPGLIFIICFGIYQYHYSPMGKHKSEIKKHLISGAIVLLMLFHIGINQHIFLSDIFPTRMAVSKAMDWLENNNITEINTYWSHRSFRYTANVLHSAKREHTVKFHYQNTLFDKYTRYMLLPPISDKSVWMDCIYNEFDRDPFLNELWATGQLYDYVVAEFPTMGASRFWAQEEEICAYRDLIVRDITETDRLKSRLWIIDLEKIHREWLPNRE